jgi:hypothetical protein
MILDQRRKASLARHVLLRLEPRVHLTVGSGECCEAASETHALRSDPRAYSVVTPPTWLER